MQLKLFRYLFFLGSFGQLANVKGTGNGDLRLRGGDSYFGRVEVFYDAVWGTVCDDYWDLYDGDVVCRQLGLGPAVSVYYSAYYGEGTGPIIYDDVACSGYEERLEECVNRGLYNHNCDHGEDAAVRCSTSLPPTSFDNRTVEGSVRLADGIYPNEGRVEVYFDGSWGTVCKDGWDLDDANVVCQQLGYSHAIDAGGVSYYGEGYGFILLGDVDCMGYESFLLECHHNGVYMHDCSHSDDASVVCFIEFGTTPPYGPVRLAGSSSPHEGRVEIYLYDRWGTICDDYWGYDDALVVCQQLGFSTVTTYSSGTIFGEGSGPILRQIDCNGDEYSLIFCSHDDWDTSVCSHSEDVSVVCGYPEEYFRDGEVRLMGTSLENTGRVEIYHLGVWGTVCSDYWGFNDADVVCRQLGYPDGAYSIESGPLFGEGEGTMFLDGISCQGTEHYLSDCRHDGWLDYSCDYGDAVARCNIPEQYYPRLANGTNWYEGRVEIWNFDHWEVLCISDYYREEARTVCKQLGFSDVGQMYYNENFGNGLSIASSVYFSCGLYDTSLSSCIPYYRGSDHSEATAIRCKHDERSSAGTTAGVISALLFFILIAITCCVVIVVKHTSRRNRRSTPGVAVISRSDNLATTQSTSTGPQAMTYRPRTHMEGTAPPSYNEAILHRPVSNSMTPQPFSPAVAMHANLTLTSTIQVPPNPAFPNISTPSVAHPLPPNANFITNQHYNVQSPSHPIQQNTGPSYPPNQNTLSMYDSVPRPQAFPYDGRPAQASALTPTDNPSMVQDTTNQWYSNSKT